MAVLGETYVCQSDQPVVGKLVPLHKTMHYVETINIFVWVMNSAAEPSLNPGHAVCAIHAFA